VPLNAHGGCAGWQVRGLPLHLMSRPVLGHRPGTPPPPHPRHSLGASPRPPAFGRLSRALCRQSEAPSEAASLSSPLSDSRCRGLLTGAAAGVCYLAARAGQALDDGGRLRRALRPRLCSQQSNRAAALLAALPGCPPHFTLPAGVASVHPRYGACHRARRPRPPALSSAALAKRVCTAACQQCDAGR